MTNTPFEPATTVIDDIAGDYTLDVSHSRLGFSARHAMVTTVRGAFKDFEGTAHIDTANPAASKVALTIKADSIDTGVADRDAHLRSADFFDVDNHPRITFSGRFTERTAGTAFKGEVELTIRGVTRTVPLDIGYLGEWRTPWWEGDVNKGEMRRVGFEATARIDRRDFGVSWQDEIPGGGVVVSNEIELALDIEAILLDDLERTGAIDYYRR
jgi:polyisoprenoid-binding protein YceI